MNYRALHEFLDMLSNFLTLLFLEEMTGFPDDNAQLLPGGWDQAAEEHIGISFCNNFPSTPEFGFLQNVTNEGTFALRIAVAAMRIPAGKIQL